MEVGWGLGIDRKGATGRGEPRIYKHGELFGNGRGEKSTEGVGRLLFNDFWTKCAVSRGAFSCPLSLGSFYHWLTFSSRLLRIGRFVLASPSLDRPPLRLSFFRTTLICSSLFMCPRIPVPPLSVQLASSTRDFYFHILGLPGSSTCARCLLNQLTFL